MNLKIGYLPWIIIRFAIWIGNKLGYTRVYCTFWGNGYIPTSIDFILNFDVLILNFSGQALQNWNIRNGTPWKTAGSQHINQSLQSL